MKHAIDFKKFPVTSLIPGAPEKEKEFNAKEAWESALIDTKKKLNKPPAALIIRDGLTDEVVICTLGNISVVSGLAKSQKTGFTSISTAAAISGDYVCDKILGTLPEGKKAVICLDTEQSEYDAQGTTKRILKLAGVEDDPLFKPAMLRDYTPEERAKTIEYAIASTPELGLVVIDGIRDLVTSINDEEQCMGIVTKLMQWSTKYFCHIMVVIHENKTGGQIRGHLGTELQNKAETVISVKKVENDNVSIVSARDTRGRPFQKFAIYYNVETNLPDIDHDYKITSSGNSGQGKQGKPKNQEDLKKRLWQYSDSEHIENLTKMYKGLGVDRVRVSELQDGVKVVYGDNFYRQDANSCGQFFLDNGLLEKIQEGKGKQGIFYCLSEKVKEGKEIPF